MHVCCKVLFSRSLLTFSPCFDILFSIDLRIHTRQARHNVFDDGGDGGVLGEVGGEVISNDKVTS